MKPSRAFTSLFLASLFAITTCGQTIAEVTIEGPDEVAAGERFDVDVSGLVVPIRDLEEDSGPLFRWAVVPASAAMLRDRMEIQRSGDGWVVVPYCTVTPKATGKCGIVLAVVLDTAAKKTRGRELMVLVHDVTVGPVAPTPNPTPEPTPPPDEGVWGALILYESSQKTEDLAKLQTSTQAREWMKKNGLPFYIYDKDLKIPIVEDYLPVVAKLGDKLPCLLVIGEEGSILSHGPPPTVEKFLATMEGLVKHGR